MNRFTIKSQLPAAIAATATAVQFATNSKTTMVFLYMYVHCQAGQSAKYKS